MYCCCCCSGLLLNNNGRSSIKIFFMVSFYGLRTSPHIHQQSPSLVMLRYVVKIFLLWFTVTRINTEECSWSSIKMLHLSDPCWRHTLERYCANASKRHDCISQHCICVCDTVQRSFPPGFSSGMVSELLSRRSPSAVMDVSCTPKIGHALWMRTQARATCFLPTTQWQDNVINVGFF